ncbi:hypothetical protein AAG570_008410 [Ranatra chinensis]|uniref:Uncharacterized protein n=1 Tax=Ranatra chinensis TaxID=642074 RepID=A0ABD0YQU7_9HEMI
MASKRRNMFHKNKTQETTEKAEENIYNQHHSRNLKNSRHITSENIRIPLAIWVRYLGLYIDKRVTRITRFLNSSTLTENSDCAETHCTRELYSMNPAQVYISQVEVKKLVGSRAATIAPTVWHRLSSWGRSNSCDETSPTLPSEIGLERH